MTNTNKIADMIERISPVRPDKCPPVIENSDQTLRDICYEKAHSIYGEDLPQVVTEASGEGAALHYFQWIRGYVYHCPEAGVEVQCGRLSGWIPRICRFLLRSHHGGNHRGQSASAPLLLPGLPLQRFRVGRGAQIRGCGRLRYAGQGTVRSAADP